MKILKLAIVFLMTAWVSSANATLIFDFKLTDRLGATVLTGEILGLQDNASGSASELNFFITPSIWADSPLAALDFTSVRGNTFTVVNGLITDLFFFVSNTTISGVSINLFWQLPTPPTDPTSPPVRPFFQVAVGDRLANISLYVEANFSSKQRLSVPEPSTIILMSLGIAGLLFSRYRRRP